jgi:hypothetical protein
LPPQESFFNLSSSSRANLACKMPDDKELIAGITGSSASPDVPQFSTAEYTHVPGTERCAICGNAVSGEYYRINGRMACTRCAGEARAGQPLDSHAAFVRALLLGAGAAVAGMAVYATFTIVTGWYIGYLALAVGWFVAKAMMKGSGGMGGRRYQIAAVLLTYGAISVAAVPIGITYAIKHKHQAAERQQSQAQANPFPGDAGAQDAGADQDQAQAPPDAAPRRGLSPPMALGQAIVGLILLGLASPFLELSDPVHGVIGLVILFIGLRIAYQMTKARALDVDGPFPVTAG